MRVVILGVLLLTGCTLPSVPALEQSPTRVIQRSNQVGIQVYESGGNCVYVYPGYAITAVSRPSGGC